MGAWGDAAAVPADEHEPEASPRVKPAQGCIIEQRGASRVVSGQRPVEPARVLDSTEET